MKTMKRFTFHVYDKFPIVHYWKCCLLLLLSLLLLIAPRTECRKHSYNEHHIIKSKPEWSLSRTKNSECRLGSTGRYPLNATWSPDLGPPFGVWSCVECTCLPVQKKRRIVAKVSCRNIKNECPAVKCSNPVLAPGACCKLCPQQTKVFTEGVTLREENPDLEESSGKDFAVLLNGRTSRFPLLGRDLATGRLFLRRGTLHFCFILSPTTPSPNTILFMYKDGTIIEELEAQTTPYEVNNGRVCGTWTRVPRQYKTTLLKEKMWVSLLFASDSEDSISGRIARYKGVDTEIFSSLLAPLPTNNETLPGGGTAIISVSAPTDSLHISLIFNGIFHSKASNNVTILVKLSPTTRKVDPVEDSIVLQKIFTDVNQAEILTTLGDSSLRLLARGKVSLKIWSPDNPNLALEGPIISRAMCNVFSAVITSTSEKNLPSYTSGWALLYLSNEGDFEYQIKIEDPSASVKKIVFLDNKKRRKIREVEDVTSTYRDGWANGTYTKPTFRDLETLFKGRLRTRVEFISGEPLEGEFQLISASEALRSVYPILLKSPSIWVAATAWVAVDSACVMHYDIYLGGDTLRMSGQLDPTWSLRIREHDTVWDPRFDFMNVTLEHRITGREIFGHTTVLGKISLTRLYKRASYLELLLYKDFKNEDNVAILKAKVSDVKVPGHCLLVDEGSYSSREKGSQGEAPCRRDICILSEERLKKVVSKKCKDDENKVYEDGSTWKSPAHNCKRCMCKTGIIECHNEPCPKPTCSDPVTLPGQCCSSCHVVSGSLSERVCEMDNDYHSIGSFWHPFLAPTGFNLCLTCYCNVTSSNEPIVECSRVACPKLLCSEADSEIVEGSCCRKCPAMKTLPQLPFFSKNHPQDPREGKEARKIRILQSGGCLERQVSFSQTTARKNGETWLPSKLLNNRNLCVSCNCKDGNIKCARHDCLDNECRKARSCRSTRRKQSKRKNNRKKWNKNNKVRRNKKEKYG